MKARYVAVDLETSGLDPATCQILEVAAVAETDWVTPVEQLPRLRLFVSHDVYQGEPAALAMHSRIFEAHGRPGHERQYDTVEAKYLASKLASFAATYSGGRTPTLAGKNVGTFDLRFLERLPNWDRARFRHRVIDPGVLYFDPATDSEVPDTAECLTRAGLVNDKPHSALHDCYAVIGLVREAYRRRAAERRLAEAFK